VAAYLAEHPYTSAVEVAEVRAAERSKDPHTVPYPVLVRVRGFQCAHM